MMRELSREEMADWNRAGLSGVKTEIGGNTIIYEIKGIVDDMGSGNTLRILVDKDGDVILSMYSKDGMQLGSMEICTRMGGGGFPSLNQKLRELAAFICDLKEASQGR